MTKPARSQNKALPKARAARELTTPDGYLSGQARMKFPADEAEEWTAQNSKEKGAVWMDGLEARRHTLRLLRALDLLCPLSSPSWIVDGDGVTVVWGDWSATAPTQVQAILLILEKVLPDG